MSARDVIARAGLSAVRASSFVPDTNARSLWFDADHILAALAAEGIGLYDTATHAAVPREEATSNSVQESLRDSSYLAGMNAGWNYGISDDRDGYDATLLAFRGYLAPVRSAQKEKRRAHLSTGAEAEAKGGE